ncbi:MAG: S-methyl-5-thioribose-1-phosphate isomerase, partial [Planctomycetes bacterium]|nr:S-methyl-5-thioribose-1-phosphate isomerase [Planctomycetota bacterium]
MSPPATVVEWKGDAKRGFLRLLDQRKLPAEEAFVDCRDAQMVWEAINRLAVRGAPAIGVAAGYAMVLAAQFIPDGGDFMTGVEAAAEYLSSSRPTAVNLHWAVQRIFRRAQGTITGDFDNIRDAMLAEAREIHAEDERMCMEIGRVAAPLILAEGVTGVLTHCNAGALATTGIGTATAGMYIAAASGGNFRVYCDETRPLLQGSRLTAWELARG